MRFITKGKIYERSAIAEGYSQNGNQWQRMTLVLEVPRGNYSKKVAFNVMTGNIAAVMAFNNVFEDIYNKLPSKDYEIKLV